MHFYQQGQIRIEYLRHVDTPVMQLRIWYIQKSKKWLTAGKDHRLYQWAITKRAGQHLQGKLERTIDLFKDDITQIVEVKHPACIAMCSLDKTIIMYDLTQGITLKKLEGQHSKGILNLRYQ